MFRVPEPNRVTDGPMGTKHGSGNEGYFTCSSCDKPHNTLRIIASDGMGWEHVSVSLANRLPTWNEMCLVKRMFWDEEDCVVQFHPPKSQYVNCHPYCLHLWRKVGSEFEMPPSILVGPK